jgi:hypothetical protein
MTSSDAVVKFLAKRITAKGQVAGDHVITTGLEGKIDSATGLTRL